MNTIPEDSLESNLSPQKQFQTLVQYQPCKIQLTYNLKKLERKNAILQIVQNKDDTSEKTVHLVLPKSPPKKFFASLQEDEEDMLIQFAGEIKEMEWEEQVVLKKKTVSSTTFKVRCPSQCNSIKGVIEITLPSPEQFIECKKYLEQCQCKLTTSQENTKSKAFASASGYKSTSVFKPMCLFMPHFFAWWKY